MINFVGVVYSIPSLELAPLSNSIFETQYISLPLKKSSALPKMKIHYPVLLRNWKMSICFVRGFCITTVTQRQKELMLKYPMLCLTLKQNGAQLTA